MDYLIGRTLGQYRIMDVIGAGARGTVFRAEQVVLSQPRAIKIPNPQLAAEPGFLDRFLREARLAAALRHPNIVQVYDADVSGGYHYIAMELLTGTSLADILRTDGALPTWRAMDILRQVAAALDYAHREDPAGQKPRVIHRDVKPENIMVAPDNHATLVDFGIARATEGTVLTGAGGLVGSAAYMAPEVIVGGRPGPSADLYSLGVVAYELLTGRIPFTGSTVVAIMDAHVNQLPTPPRSLQPSLPAAAEAVLLRQLAKDPAERYPSGAAFVEALDAALTGEITAEWATPAAAPVPPPADPAGRPTSDTPTEELPPLSSSEPTRPASADPTRQVPGDPTRATAAARRTPTQPQPRPVPPPRRAIVRADARRPAPARGSAPSREFTPARRPWLLYGLIAAAFLLAFVGLALLWPLIGGTNRSGPPTAAPSATAAPAENPALAAAGTTTATPTLSPSPTERPNVAASPSPPTPSPTLTPTPSPASEPTATPTPPPPTATPVPAGPARFGLRIDAPANRAQVPREITVRGAQTAPRPPGSHLWLFVSAQVPGSRWYPCPRGELVAGPDLAWSCDLYLGGPPGTRHTIVLGLVDDSTNAELARYMAASPNQPVYPDVPTAALPPGFAEQASIEVSVQ